MSFPRINQIYLKDYEEPIQLDTQLYPITSLYDLL